MRANLKPGEDILILPSNGRLHLCKDGYLCVFKTMGEAEKAAQRTGGSAYRSKVTKAFLVRYEK